MTAISIEPISEKNRAKEIDIIQQLTWGKSAIEVIPANFMLDLAKNNAGVFLGAVSNNRYVGFAFAVIGMIHETKNRTGDVITSGLRMNSLIVGVLPEFQNQGIGYQLKLAQRDFAMKIGVREIFWVYDPLESQNAQFNIGKLGATCQTYHRNFHGELTGINAGLDTDRFEVNWYVASGRVQDRLNKNRQKRNLVSVLDEGAMVINKASHNDRQHLEPPKDFIKDAAKLKLVEIPSDFQSIKRYDLRLAQQWRTHTRNIFEYLFQEEYYISDFILHENSSGLLHSYYLLQKRAIVSKLDN